MLYIANHDIWIKIHILFEAELALHTQCSKRYQFHLQQILQLQCRLRFAMFDNFSNISWRSVLLVEETGVPGENHRPAACESRCYRRVSSSCTTVEFRKLCIPFIHSSLSHFIMKKTCFSSDGEQQQQYQQHENSSLISSH